MSNIYYALFCAVHCAAAYQVDASGRVVICEDFSRRFQRTDKIRRAANAPCGPVRYRKNVSVYAVKLGGGHVVFSVHSGSPPVAGQRRCPCTYFNTTLLNVKHLFQRLRPQALRLARRIGHASTINVTTAAGYPNSTAINIVSTFEPPLYSVYPCRHAGFNAHSVRAVC